MRSWPPIGSYTSSPSSSNRSNASRTIATLISSSLAACSINSSFGRTQWPSPVASNSVCMMPARARMIESRAIPSFCADGVRRLKSDAMNILGRVGRAEPDLSAFDQEAIDAYVRAYADPRAIHASCEDYRASGTIDLEHDRADAGRKIDTPLLVLWGAQAVV